MSTRRRKVVRSRQNQDENKRKKRLLVALLMLILTGVALTTATYAWFSSNTVVDTTDIDLKVTAATGISISADALNFKKTISMTEVIAFAQDGCQGTDPCPSRMQYPDKLNPVSTIGGFSPKFYRASIGDFPNSLVGYIADFEGESQGSFDLTSGSEDCVATHSCTHTAGDYIAFDFWLRSGADYNLDIDPGSMKINSHAVDTTSLEDGIRIMFVNLGNEPDATKGQKAFYDLNDTSDGNWTIVNPYPTRHHNTSLTSSYYNLPSGVKKDGNVSDDGEFKLGYYAVKNLPDPLPGVKYNKKGLEDNDNGKLIPFTYWYLQQDHSYDDVFQLIDDQNLHYAQAGGFYGEETNDGTTGRNVLKIKSGVTRVRAYIWLEGQDIDTVDAISFSKGFYFNFGFKIRGNGA